MLFVEATNWKYPHFWKVLIFGNLLILDHKVSSCFSRRRSWGKRRRRSCRCTERYVVAGHKSSLFPTILCPLPFLLSCSSPSQASLTRCPISRYQWTPSRPYQHLSRYQRNMSAQAPLVLPGYIARNRMKAELTANCSLCNCGIYSIYSQCGHIAVEEKHYCGRREIQGTPLATFCVYPPRNLTCNYIIVTEPCGACTNATTQS